MSKIPSISRQYSEDLEQSLSKVRAELNREIREKCFKILDKKKNLGIDKNV